MKPSDVFGVPQDVLGNDIHEQDTWLEWLMFPRHRPIMHEFKNNVKAGVTVALVNVPLSISLSIASGGSPAAGVVSAVWAAGISAMTCSSHFNVVGPTGALSGMLAVTAHRYGPDILPVVSLIAAAWLLLFFAVRLDRYMRYVSTGVEHGFSIGVACIIAAAQIPAAFGLTGLAPQEKLLDKVAEDAKHFTTLNKFDTTIFFCTFIPLWYLIRNVPKIPWQIVLVGVGIAIGINLPEDQTYITLLKNKYPTLSLSLFSPINLTAHQDHYLQLDLVMYSFGVALVALLETLVSSRIANNNAPDKSFLNYSSRRDTVGLALTNAIVGLFGGIPATAALARTSLNIKSGAFSRVAGLVSCATVAVLCSILLPLFKYIPMAVIAGILAMVAYRLIDFNELREINEVDEANMYSLIVTAAACVLTDTFAGLMIGMAISVALNWRHFTEDNVDFTVSNGDETIIVLSSSEDAFASPMTKASTTQHSVVRRVVPVVTVTAKVKAPFVFNNADDVKRKIVSEPLKLLSHDELEKELCTPPSHQHIKLVIDLEASERMDFDGAKVLSEIIQLYRNRGWLVDVTHHEHLRHSLSHCHPLLEHKQLEYAEV